MKRRHKKKAVTQTWRRHVLSFNRRVPHSEQKSGADAGQPLVNTPKHMYNSNLRFTVTERLNTWVRVEARANRTRGSNATSLAATEQVGPFKGYGMAHLGGSYKLTKQLTFNATVYNLFNKDFLGYEPYIYNGATTYARLYNILQEPRRFWGSLTYQF